MATREQLLAEARRRGLIKDDAAVPEPSGRAALLAEAKRRKLVGPDFDGGELEVGETQPTKPGRKPSITGTIGQFGTGAVESVADTMGLPADLLFQGLRKAGVPIPGGERMIRDWYAGNGAVLSGMPSNSVERMARGAGRGVGDVAQMVVPAGAVAAGAKAGSMSGRLAAMLASNPGLQAAAGAAGGAVSAESGNPLMGAATAAAVPVGVGLARAVPGAVRAMPGVVGRGIGNVMDNAGGGLAGGALGYAVSQDPVGAVAGAAGGAVVKEALDTLSPWLKQQVANGSINVKDALLLQAKIAGGQAVSAGKRK